MDVCEYDQVLEINVLPKQKSETYQDKGSLHKMVQLCPLQNNGFSNPPPPQKKKVICAKWKNMKRGKDNMKITGAEAMKTDLITQKCFQISKFENRQ